MECGPILTMRRALLVLALLCGAHFASAAQQSVVLVVRADSSVVDLDPLTLRKLFLGMPVLINGSPIHAIRNRSDERLDQIFLQEIAAMSQSAYDRQILIGVNRQGWVRPQEVQTNSRALERVYADPNTVTFMWERDVAHDPKIRVIRVLWTD
jgi:hypothetical protein